MLYLRKLGATAFTIALLSNATFGQSATHKLEIQQVDLRDSIVVREIKKLIIEEVATVDLARRGLGYVQLHIHDYPDLNSKFIRKYEFFISFLAPHSSWLEAAYSPFYTYVGGRLVFIDVGELPKSLAIAYSAKSKRLVRRLTNPFLEKPERMVFRDLNGKKVFTDRHGRIDHIRFDSGKVVYVRRDGSILVRRANDFSPVE